MTPQVGTSGRRSCDNWKSFLESLPSGQDAKCVSARQDHNVTAGRNEPVVVRDNARLQPNAAQRRVDRLIFRLALIFIIAAVAAVGLVYLQARNIQAGWSACFTQSPNLDAGGNFAATFNGVARLVGYPLALGTVTVLVAVPARSTRLAYLVAAAGFTVAALGVFWFDYAHNNGLALGSWQARCPSGRPPGWPSWSGIHPTT